MAPKKKILIVVGTRPNFIKISQFDREFKKYNGYFEYKLIHTGQHYDKNMSDVFFQQFKLKAPDIFLNVKGKSPAEQIGTIIIQLSEIIADWQPDFVITPGDVNSTLAAAIAANKCGVRLGHLESGLRSFDLAMPEEINRMLTDTITDEFFVTEQSGIDNLKKELPHASNIHFVGNTMIDTLVALDDEIQQSNILEELNLNEKEYALMTMHRPRNVDSHESLSKLLTVVNHITNFLKLVFPIHPRTEKSLKEHGLHDQLKANDSVIITNPLGYLEFQKLIAKSALVITDSGGIQEETTFRQVPCITLRPNTERPSTVELGTNVLLDFDCEAISEQINKIQNGMFKKGHIPPFWDGKATQRIVEILERDL